MVFPAGASEQQGAVLDVLPHPVCLFDVEGAVLFVNRAWTAFTGRTADAELGTGWLTHLAAADRAAWSGRWRSASAAGETVEMEWRWRRTDGRLAWVQFTLTPLPRTPGSPSAWLGACHDITPQREAEEAARAKAAQVQVLANGVPVLIAHFSADNFTCLLANKAYARTWGVDENKIVGMRVPEIIGPDGWKQIEPYVRRVLKGETVSYERVITPPSGERVIEVMLIPHLDDNGIANSAFVMINDITRHRQAERVIRDSEERLKKFTEATNEGILFHDQGRVIDCNDAMARMIGSPREQMIGRSIFEFVAPEAVDQIRGNIETAFEKTYESVILRADGSRIAVEITGKQMLFDGVIHRMTVIRDITDRKEAEARIQFLAHHDTLTQLPNRLMMMDRLEHMLAAAKRHAKMVGVLFIDLDNFKTVNDSLGHHAGDELLKRVAGRIQSCLRAADMVARLGGDEFLVVVSDLALAEDVVPVAEKLLQTVSESFSIEGHVLTVSPSIGISIFPRDGNDRDALIKNADAAMYLAKESGRNNFQFYTAQLNKGAFEALAMESGIRRAIEQVQWMAHYQPEVSLFTGELTGIEALIRWKHPELGVLGPDKFISVAEHRGLIMPIGKWMLNEAVRQNADWQRMGLPKVPIAVNLSPLQFRQPQLVEIVQRALEEAGLEGQYLELEITENLLMQDTQQVARTLGELKRLGVKLTVDDFGAGYSSLSYLKRYPIDKLKIDRSFVRHVPGSIEDTAITNAMISLSKSLGMKVLAEGVEREAQADFLRGQKCDEMQGYLVAAPMSAVDFEAWIASYQPARLPLPG
ncbi:MAG: EAL domain-containing protein [Betaproteobacteria bacterium]|nr:EAL domain-containing protein [Betaproteobacteria bacterium]